MAESGPMLREALAHALPTGPTLGSETDERIAAWLRRGRDAWPDVDIIDEAGFVAHVGRLVSKSTSPLDEADGRHIEDLYLAFACGRGSPTALRRFGATHRRALELTHATWRGPAVELDDFLQAVHERLLVGPSPRILSYQGRGSLEGWIKMVALRRLIDLGHQQRRAPSPRSDDVLVTLMMPARELSTQLVQHRYRPDVQEAITRGLRRLTTAQRILLRQRFVLGLSLADLARHDGVHRVTVSKRLARARQGLAEALRDELSARLGGESRVESIAQLCLSQLDLSLGTLLDEEPSDTDSPD